MRGGKEKDGVPRVRRKPGRVPTSCAECRRLKLRCDKNVPCEKCVSRGCGSICPNGSLTTGKGNRLVLANTEELHDRIESLSTRIRELEDALRTLQQSVSDKPHPLLQKDVSQPIPPQSPPPTPVAYTPAPRTASSLPEEPPDYVEHPTQADDDDDDFIDAFGTLTLGQRNQMSFFGKTARSEYLIRAVAHEQLRASPAPLRLSRRLTEASYPEAGACDPELGTEIFCSLPPLSEAIRLCEIYQEHGKFMYFPVPRQQLFDEILNTVYRANSFDAVPCYHSFSLLLIVFALGALFDPDRKPYSTEAQEFYHLSRATFKFKPQTTQMLIQALIHIAQFLDFSDGDSTGSNSSWLYVGHAVRLGHSAGLHVNGSRWNLPKTNVLRRNYLFWQLFYLDTWSSFSFGRPPIMSAAFTDCPISMDDDETTVTDLETPTFHTWNWKYTVLLHTIMLTAFGPKRPTYTSVLSLDRRVRDFPIPTAWQLICHDPDKAGPMLVELHVQRWIILSTKESTLLNLHRAYFMRALQEAPTDLARHQYTPSVIAIYRSAWRLIEGLRYVWKNAPHPLSRTSLAWSHGLSAAIVMCLLVARAPTSNMTPSALAELDIVLELFRDAAPNARAAANLLDSIVNLHRKAHDSMDHGVTRSASCAPSDAELDRLGGKTHLLHEVDTPDAGTRGRPGSDTMMNATTGHFSDAQVNSMHPTLAHGMRSFDSAAPTSNDFFDFPTTKPYPSPMPDIYPAEINAHLAENYIFQLHQPMANSFEQAAPILDPTWQSFVEQLGF